MASMQRSDFRNFHRLQVRWVEVDMQKIVFNAHYLMYFDTAMSDYWRRLALRGLSVWPEAAEAEVVAFLPALRRFGYPEAAAQDVLAAFRLRFRPWGRGALDRVDAGLACDLARRFGLGGTHQA